MSSDFGCIGGKIEGQETPTRALMRFRQQNQDSPFELGVVTVIAGHSGPGTAADARSHFGVFAPQVWTLFPRGQVCMQPEEYRQSILPDSQRFYCMVVTTMTKRVMPLANLGPLTEEYTLASDHDDRWRTGGLEPDVIAEAKLDPESIYQGVKRFVDERERRLGRQRDAFAALG